MLKKLALCAVTCFVLASVATAGTSMASGKEYKDYKQPAPLTCFDDTEFQLDLFGTAIGVQNAGVGAGGGIGLNFYFIRYVGVGIDGMLAGDGDGNFIGNTTGNLLIRIPIDSICLAPYFLGGGGYQFDGNDGGILQAGGGLEYRFIRHSLAVYGEGRYVWGFDTPNNVQARLGLKIVF